MDRQIQQTINRELELKWGANLFRLTWADDEFETRHRTYTKVDNSGNYLGEMEETARLPKYSYCKNCYVIEKYFGGGRAPEEVKDWNNWEIIWAFEEGQIPNLEVCMFISHAIQNGVKKTLKDHYDDEKSKFDKEVEETYEVLENESPYLATMLKNREAIVVPGKPEDN
jgi:hypothetical protein